MTVGGNTNGTMIKASSHDLPLNWRYANARPTRIANGINNTTVKQLSLTDSHRACQSINQPS